jgi:hypothetical protein
MLGVEKTATGNRARHPPARLTGDGRDFLGRGRDGPINVYRAGRLSGGVNEILRREQHRFSLSGEDNLQEGPPFSALQVDRQWMPADTLPMPTALAGTDKRQ